MTAVSSVIFWAFHGGSEQTRVQRRPGLRLVKLLIRFSSRSVRAVSGYFGKSAAAHNERMMTIENKYGNQFGIR